MRHLVLAHGHIGRAIDEDVRALQQRIAQEAVGREILLLQLLLLILVAGHALQPTQRRDHRQQQVQLGVLRHVRLDEQCRNTRIQTRREPVDQHVLDLLRQLRGSS